MKTLVAAAALLSPNGTMPEQCVWVDNAMAEQVQTELLKPGATVAHLCEPCGDREGHSEQIQTSTVVKNEDGSASSVTINGKAVDLAYVYVLYNFRFFNIAGLIGCPTRGVTFDFVG